MMKCILIIYTKINEYLLSIELVVLNIVVLFPRRILPPLSPVLCSGISTTTGDSVLLSISVVFAFFMPKAFLKQTIIQLRK